MPELSFQITGVEGAAEGLTPFFHFNLRVVAAPPTEPIQGLLLNAQVQIQPPQRSYAPAEQEKLSELFGAPQNWGRSLRNRLWTHANAITGGFVGTKELRLPVACSFDLNIATTKYFYALDSGDVSLLFLFSGSVFYANAEGRLQVERISWDKECEYRIPIAVWRGLMEQFYPNCGWLYLRRDIFERLYEYRRRHGLANWDQTIDDLLPLPATESDPEMETLKAGTQSIEA